MKSAGSREAGNSGGRQNCRRIGMLVEAYDRRKDMEDFMREKD